MASTNQEAIKYPINILSVAGEKLYLSKEFADFHFVFASGERIPVHKILLAISSDVLRAMFNNSWKEKTEVEIVDASAGAFKEFLQFFYLGNATMTMENVSEVMNLGKKYNVTECFDICGDFFEKNCTDDEVCLGYELAVHLEHEQLEAFCKKVIQTKTKVMFASESILKCDQKTVQRILQMDLLNCSEADLFEGLMRWMKAQSEQDELTKEIVQGKFIDLLHEIRFGSMTAYEIAQIDASYGHLFTQEEHREIIQMIASKEFQPKVFRGNRRERFFQWNPNEVIECNRCVENDYDLPPYFIKNIEKTQFSINEPVLLGAFYCIDISLYEEHEVFKYGEVSKLPTEFKIVEIRESKNAENDKVILFNGKAELDSVENTSILLPSPILIRPGLTYEIQLEQSPPENYATSYIFKKKVTEQNITVDFLGAAVEDANDVREGLVSSLEFNKI